MGINTEATLHKKWSFPLRISSVNVTKSAGNLVTFTEEILNGKLFSYSAMGLENEDFSDEDQCQCMYTWEFFAYIFFGIRLPSQTPPWWITSGKFPPGIFLPMLLNIPARVFWLFSFFSLLLPLSLICFKSAEIFTFVKICQNEVLSKKRQLMKWVGIRRVRIFWVAIFRGKIFQGGVWWVGIFQVGISPGRLSLETCSLYDVSILIFQKNINKYNKTFNKRIYTLNSKFLSRNVSICAKYFKHKALKAMEFWVVNKWQVLEKCKS